MQMEEENVVRYLVCEGMEASEVETYTETIVTALKNATKCTCSIGNISQLSTGIEMQILYNKKETLALSHISSEEDISVLMESSSTEIWLMKELFAARARHVTRLRCSRKPRRLSTFLRLAGEMTPKQVGEIIPGVMITLLNPELDSSRVQVVNCDMEENELFVEMEIETDPLRLRRETVEDICKYIGSNLVEILNDRGLPIRGAEVSTKKPVYWGMKSTLQVVAENAHTKVDSVMEELDRMANQKREDAVKEDKAESATVVGTPIEDVARGNIDSDEEEGSDLADELLDAKTELKILNGKQKQTKRQLGKLLEQSFAATIIVLLQRREGDQMEDQFRYFSLWREKTAEYHVLREQTFARVAAQLDKLEILRLELSAEKQAKLLREYLQNWLRASSMKAEDEKLKKFASLRLAQLRKTSQLRIEVQLFRRWKLRVEQERGLIQCLAMWQSATDRQASLIKHHLFTQWRILSHVLRSAGQRRTQAASVIAKVLSTSAENGYRKSFVHWLLHARLSQQTRLDKIKALNRINACLGTVIRRWERVSCGNFFQRWKLIVRGDMGLHLCAAMLVRGIVEKNIVHNKRRSFLFWRETTEKKQRFLHVLATNHEANLRFQFNMWRTQVRNQRKKEVVLLHTLISEPALRRCLHQWKTTARLMVKYESALNRVIDTVSFKIDCKRHCFKMWKRASRNSMWAKRCYTLENIVLQKRQINLQQCLYKWRDGCSVTRAEPRDLSQTPEQSVIDAKLRILMKISSIQRSQARSVQTAL